jgi:hypothetical protein
MNRYAQRLVDAGIVSADDVDDINKALEKTATGGLRKAALSHRIDMAADEATNIMASVTAAGATSPLINGSQALMVNGAVRRGIKQHLLRRKYSNNVIQQLNEFIVNPQKYVDAAKNAKTADEAAKSILTAIFGVTAIQDNVSDSLNKER